MNLDAAHRPYHFPSMTWLATEARERITGWKSYKVLGDGRKPKKKRDEVVAELMEQDRIQGGPRGLSKSDELKVRLLQRIIQSSTLPKPYGKSKEYCKRGHHLEKRLAKAMLDEKDSLDLEKLFEVGIVHKKDEPYVKDSIDYLGLTTSNEVVGIEMKSRLRPATDQAQREILHMSQGSFGDSKIVNVTSDSPDLEKYIPSTHEVVQVLHHAYTYDLDQVWLVAGDDEGRTIG